MTDVDRQDADLTTLRALAKTSRVNLLNRVVDFCPKPHIVQQYRDGQPPWCRVCGRTAEGVRMAPGTGNNRD